MGGHVFAAIIGVAFVIGGRWLFIHPHKLAPSWSFGESRTIQDFGKFFAICLVFVGSFTVITATAAVFVADWISVLLAFPAAFVVTWKLLRQLRARSATES